MRRASAPQPLHDRASSTISRASNGVVNRMPDFVPGDPNRTNVTAPDPGWCSRRGGGGDYLSNESAYQSKTTNEKVCEPSMPADKGVRESGPYEDSNCKFKLPT